MQEKIWFKNSKGDKLCGILSGTKAQYNGPVIILCHGLGTNKDNRTNKRLEEILNKNNIATFRFDFYGHGESDGKFENVTASEAVGDVLKASDFLRKMGYEKIGLIGSSFGGITGLLAAPKIKKLFVMAFKCPVSDYPASKLEQLGKSGIDEWKKKRYIFYKTWDGRALKLKWSFFEDLKNNIVYESAKKINVPVLIVHGDKDDTVPIGQSIKTARLIKNCRLEIIKGADHFLSKQKDFEKCIKLISNFIIKNSK